MGKPTFDLCNFEPMLGKVFMMSTEAWLRIYRDHKKVFMSEYIGT